MLGMKAYSRDYVDGCRRLVDAQIENYDAVVSAATGKGAAALGAFEPGYLNCMVLVLDQLFVHRLRGQEGKDGNPLNEVRVLCASIMENDGVLMDDKAIKLDPAKSVLGLAAGDRIEIGPADFARLSDAFFAELEKRFV